MVFLHIHSIMAIDYYILLCRYMVLVNMFHDSYIIFNYYDIMVALFSDMVDCCMLHDIF